MNINELINRWDICIEHQEPGVDDELRDLFHDLVAERKLMIEALNGASVTVATISAACHGGYDWNADPLSLTLLEGQTFAAIAAALTKAHICSACRNPLDEDGYCDACATKATLANQQPESEKVSSADAMEEYQLMQEIERARFT